jgi:hypothetical protein
MVFAGKLWRVGLRAGCRGETANYFVTRFAFRLVALKASILC